MTFERDLTGTEHYGVAGLRGSRSLFFRPTGETVMDYLSDREAESNVAILEAAFQAGKESK